MRKFKNQQQIFDYVLKKLFKQEVAACDSAGDCVYSNEKGQRCAVGWLIPTKTLLKYATKKFETDTAEVFCKRRKFRKYFQFKRENASFLLTLQSMHDAGLTDNLKPTEEEMQRTLYGTFLRKARTAAHDFGLNTIVLDKWEAKHVARD